MLQVAYDEYRTKMAEQYVASLPTEDYDRMFREARQRFRKAYGGMTEEQVSDLPANFNPQPGCIQRRHKDVVVRRLLH
jgi:hypothetical protein